MGTAQRRAGCKRQSSTSRQRILMNPQNPQQRTPHPPGRPLLTPGHTGCSTPPINERLPQHPRVRNRWLHREGPSHKQLQDRRATFVANHEGWLEPLSIRLYVAGAVGRTVYIRSDDAVAAHRRMRATRTPNIAVETIRQLCGRSGLILWPTRSCHRITVDEARSEQATEGQRSRFRKVPTQARKLCRPMWSIEEDRRWPSIGSAGCGAWLLR